LRIAPQLISTLEQNSRYRNRQRYRFLTLMPGTGFQKPIPIAIPNPTIPIKDRPEAIWRGETQQSLEDKSRILYLAFMRLRYLLFCILFSTGCGASRSINNNLARDRIMEIPQGSLEKEDVEVLKVTRIGGSEAIAETRLKTAFRIEKVKGEWVVREVRIGHGQWEKITHLSAAIEAAKIDETKQMLERLAEAIRKYREDMGSLPAFKDYITLSDQLSPKYLTPLIRLDSWRHPLWAERTNEGTIILQSAGPDRSLGTKDDLILTVSK
jgi:hypothetical protein